MRFGELTYGALTLSFVPFMRRGVTEWTFCSDDAFKLVVGCLCKIGDTH